MAELVTPTNDYALNDLAIYLAERLNAQYPGCVSSVFGFDYLADQVGEYPSLCVFESEAREDDLSVRRVTIRYMLYSLKDKRTLPGLFRWVQMAIVELLLAHDPEARSYSIKRPLDPVVSNRINATAIRPFFDIKVTVFDNTLRDLQGEYPIPIESQ